MWRAKPSIASAIWGFGPAKERMTHLSTGDKAPNFTLDTDAGTSFRLSEQRGRPVVLYFYPEDGTEGCTIENAEFSALAPAFREAGVTLLGISPDSVEKHCGFRDKHGLAVRLAADPAHEAIAAYGVWGQKKLYGRAYDGLFRTTFLIDAKGRIAGVWPVRRIKGHAQKVLEAAKALVSGA